MNSFVENWNHEHKAYFEKLAKLEASVARAKKRLEKHQNSYPTWVEGIVEPIAKQLAELRDMQYELTCSFR